jgi:hypothetical protein
MPSPLRMITLGFSGRALSEDESLHPATVVAPAANRAMSDGIRRREDMFANVSGPTGKGQQQIVNNMR